MGKPEPFEMKTEEDAMNYLSKRSQNPAMYATELARFKTIVPEGKGKRKWEGANNARVVERRKAPNGHILTKMSDGRIMDETSGMEVR
jgi:hypothetical protein